MSAVPRDERPDVDEIAENNGESSDFDDDLGPLDDELLDALTCDLDEPDPAEWGFSADDEEE